MRTTALVSLALLAGCHHHSPQVIQTGPDSYLVGATSHSGFKSDMAVTAAAMAKANAFCQRQDLMAEMIGNQSSGAEGFTAQNAQVHFRCVRAPAARASSPT